jgi:hypothetical protein
MYKVSSLIIFVLIFGGCHGGIFSRVGNGMSNSLAESRVETAKENIHKSKREIKTLKLLRKQKLELLVKYIDSSNRSDELLSDQIFLEKYIKDKHIKKLPDGERRKALLSYRLQKERLIKSPLELQAFTESKRVTVNVKNGFEIEKNYTRLSSAVSSEISNFLKFSSFLKFEREPERVSLTPPTYRLDFSEDEKDEYKKLFRKYNREIASFNRKASTFNYSLEKDRKFYSQNYEESKEKIENFSLKALPKAVGNLSLHFGKWRKGLLEATLYSTDTNFIQKFYINRGTRTKAREVISNFKNGKSDIEVEFWIENGNLKYEFSKFEVAEENLIGYLERKGKKFEKRLKFRVPTQGRYSLKTIPEKTLESIADDAFDNDLRAELEEKSFAELDTKKWLVVIGVENYDDLEKVTHSVRSSKLFKDTFHKLLGVPKNQILTAIGDEATEEKILKIFQKVKKSVKKGDTLYFYYSGHGIPLANSNGASITGKDSEATSIVKGIGTNSEDFKLRKVYEKLQKTKAKKVVAVIDSCFSGSAENENGQKEGLLSNRGLASSFAFVKPSTKDFSKLKIVTAGGEEDFSNSYDVKGHRLFTYFLLKEVIDGERDLEDIYSDVKSNVVKKSKAKGEGYTQTPTAENIESGDQL